MNEEAGQSARSSSEVVAARRDLDLAREDFELRVRDVARAGRRAWKTVRGRARPLVIAGAVVVGALLLIRILRPPSRERRSDRWRPPGEPSLLERALRSAARAMVQTVVSTLGRRVAEGLVSARVSTHDTERVARPRNHPSETALVPTEGKNT